LVGSGDEPQLDHRGHFFTAAAEAMRRILVENARRKRRQRHGGGLERVDLDAVEPAAPELEDDILALHDALDRLAGHDMTKAELVKLRCFAGLTQVEAAGMLGISTSTADRHWAFARAWLHQEIRRDA
jgi:RNA polymerase sigma factor (TIGR02999 family)